MPKEIEPQKFGQHLFGYAAHTIWCALQEQERQLEGVILSTQHLQVKGDQESLVSLRKTIQGSARAIAHNFDIMDKLLAEIDKLG
ncbi:MAG: hypothetical protein K2Y22_10390 [Candidatus Obscuribacterales bacterium]|nr:hypothetical protein [Candidatus Obscuribacterales bacterium]